MHDLVARLRQGNAPPAVSEVFRAVGAWPYARSASELLALPREPGFRTVPVAPSHSAELGREFHTLAGTLTPNVNQSLTELSVGRQCVRVAHQPNFAAYLKAFALLVASDEVAKMSGCVPVYLVNDCDVASNDRFARTMMPDFTSPRGMRYLSLPHRGYSSNSLASRRERPSRDWLNASMRLIEENCAMETRLSHIPQPAGSLTVEDINEDLTLAWEQSQTVSELTTIFLSRLTNVRLNLGVVFLQGHDVWQKVGAEVIGFLLNHWAIVVDAQIRVAGAVSNAGIDRFKTFTTGWLTDRQLAPVWWLCQCGSRVRLEFWSGSTTMQGRCQECLVAPVNIRLQNVAEEIAAGRLLPRVGALDLAEGLCSEIDVGVSYMGSGIHSLIYALVARELGLGDLPQVFLDINGAFDTPPEQMNRWARPPRAAIGIEEACDIVAAGRASATYYLTRVNIDRLVLGIRNWVSGSDLDRQVTLG